MSAITVLGIDTGGTHTDAVLLKFAQNGFEVLAQAKVGTRREDLAASVREVLTQLRHNAQAVSVAGAAEGDGAELLRSVSRVTLGTTLAINALVQNRADPVFLVLSAGPGLAPARAGLGDYVRVLQGGLDHRGEEVTPLHLDGLKAEAARVYAAGVRAAACVGKFSPRNAAHEEAAAAAVHGAGLRVTVGRRMSGRLNFPRRVATAYYNAAVERVHNEFLDAVEAALAEVGITAACRLLKADGGAVPLALARPEPVQSILSGPAASVMGVTALCPEAASGCSLLLDMGGTTTDMALLLDGSPVMDRDGMCINGRRTLVRALASVSIGVGGDSLVRIEGQGQNVPVTAGTNAATGTAVRIVTGPLREGPAQAFGGSNPTLLDALNVLHESAVLPTASFGSSGNAGSSGNLGLPDVVDAALPQPAGDAAASRRGIAAMAAMCGCTPEEVARQAVDDALHQIATAAHALIARVNAGPVYTLAALRQMRAVSPERVLLVGGPAEAVRPHLNAALNLPVFSPAHADTANAIGAALTLPTASLDVYADTSSRLLRAPALDIEESLGRNTTQEAVEARAKELLLAHLATAGVNDVLVEVVESDVFAVIDAYGRGSRDMRVSCRVTPGIAGYCKAL